MNRRRPHRLLIYLPALALMAAPGQAAILDDEDGLLFGEPDEPSALETFMTPASNARAMDDDGRNPPAAPEASTTALDTEIAPPDPLPSAAPVDPVELARSWRIRGDELVASNRMNEAARAYWQATRLNHVNAGYLHYFGFALLALGDHENGRLVYERILERYPDARKALFNLAAAHYGMGEYERAGDYLRDYHATKPRENPKALFNEALIHLARENPDDAIPLLERAIERLPDNPFVYVALTRAFRAADKMKSAAQQQALAEHRFGAEVVQRLLTTGTMPVYLER